METQNLFDGAIDIEKLEERLEMANVADVTCVIIIV